MGHLLALEQEHRLTAQFDALAAADIPAGHEIIHANHVRPRLGKLLSVFLIGPGGNLSLFGSHHPAHGEGIFLAAMRAVERHLLGFFLLIVEPLFVHGSCSVRRLTVAS